MRRDTVRAIFIMRSLGQILREQGRMDSQQSALQDNTGSIPAESTSEGEQLRTNQLPASVHRARGRSLRIAQVVPSPTSRSDHDSCNDNGDAVSSNGDSDSDSTTFEEDEEYDHSAGGFQSRNETNYRSFRLDSNSFAERLHRGPSVVHVVPNQRRYTSFRLRRSEYMYLMCVCVCVCVCVHALAKPYMITHFLLS